MDNQMSEQELLKQRQEYLDKDIKLGQQAAKILEQESWVEIEKYFESIIDLESKNFTAQWESEKKYDGWTKEQLWDEYTKRRLPLIGYWAFKNLLNSLISARDMAREEKSNEEQTK